MFADLAGSTAFEERVDPETARDVMSRYHDLVRMTAERHRAGLTKYIGDGFMAVWGVPGMGPDDAGHAVDAAVELQECFVDFAARVSTMHRVDVALRVAVNTGEIVVGSEDADLVGDAVNVAARLESECPHGEVVVGEETWRATRGRHRYDARGQVHVKGRVAPVAVYQWSDHAEAMVATPFVGRTEELRRLQSALDAAVGAGTAKLVTVVGDPGVGKSRLTAEFAAAHDGPMIRARCTLDGTIALAPLVDVLRTRDLDVDVDQTVPERDRLLRDLKGLTTGVPGSVEETFWALRRYVETLALAGPLILVIDDVHWADSLLLDFVEHLVEWVKDVPVLVLAVARPELREVRADLVTVGRWVSDTLHLRGLDPVSTAELATRVLGAARLPGDLLERLPSSTGGNPLFVRELVGMLVHDGVLVAEPAGWRLTIDVDAIAIPPTIHALLASRLERLEPGDRRTLEIASVVGTDFALGAVSALTTRGSAEVKRSLERLRQLELAQPSGAYDGDEPVWRFHHVLIRDVAYRRLLKSDRAALHEELADWLGTNGTAASFDADEATARHLEAAHGYRRELGGIDARTDALAIRSARCYLASSRRALDRDELMSAGIQAARGAALAHGDNEVRAELLLVGCEAFLSAGDVTAGAPLVDELETLGSEDLGPWATCYRCQFVVYTDPARLLEVHDRLQSAIDEFGRRRDSAGLAKAHRVRAGARARLGRVGDCEVDLFEALIAAREGGDHRQITAALGAAPSAALWGPSPLPKAGGRCLDVVRMQRMTTAAPSLEATSLRCLAVLELLRGRPDKARSMLADARKVVADLGLRHGLMETELFAGIIESMEGDPAAAEPHFRAALAGLGALGVGADAGLAAALLARTLLAQGRVDEADHYAAESERRAGHNLKTAIGWRAVRAEILAAQGSHDTAVAVAREAVALAASTDLVLDHADACLALGRVLAAAGDDAGAVSARRDAAALHATKETAGSIRMVDTPPPARASTPRLSVENRATATATVASNAIDADDAAALAAIYAPDFVHDDRRRLRAGKPIATSDAMQIAARNLLSHYSTFEYRVLAVRGEQSTLLWTGWSDDAGNETAYLLAFEVNAQSQISYDCWFDDADVGAACELLEQRYYEGEGREFAAGRDAIAHFVAAMDRSDVELARGSAAPEFRWLGPPSVLSLNDGSLDDMFSWIAQRARQLSSRTTWFPVFRWLSATCAVVRGMVQAVGLDAERYEWSGIYVATLRDGLLTSVRQFDDDEDAALAYAESVVASERRRLDVENHASRMHSEVMTALQNRDVAAAVAHWADGSAYSDKRRLPSGGIVGHDQLATNLGLVSTQFTRFARRTLAVRGDRVQLSWSSWSDGAGNESRYLHVIEVDTRGRISKQIVFDDDDFDGAYRELEQLHLVGESTANAESALAATNWLLAVNRNDLDAVFDVHSVPDLRYYDHSRSVFGNRNAAEFRESLEGLAAMVSTSRSWMVAVQWVSPTVGVSRFEREAVGLDGENYRWAWIVVTEFHDGRAAAVHQFEVDDEDAAFAYAEGRPRGGADLLSTVNRASAVSEGAARCIEAREFDAALEAYAEPFTYDDRRRLSGNPITTRAELRMAFERVRAQYERFETETLAVRGQRLHLGRGVWVDGAGNETTMVAVFETDDHGKISYHGPFDDEQAAFDELERRYYADEGAAYATSGAALTQIMTAMNRGDLDTLFHSFASPDLRIENRSRSAFPDRSASELQASVADLNAAMTSVRAWNAAILWVSPHCVVLRQEREAVGPDGEPYAWSRLLVGEFGDGVLTSLCEFDVGDEEHAVAYGRSRVSRPVAPSPRG